MKNFGFWTLTFLVVANMIGAGVFTTSGFALADLGSPWLVVVAWAIGGIIAVAGAFSYGLLVKRMPESGGEYLFLSRALHPSVGFIAGWVSLIAGFSGAIAFAATALESYVVGPRSLPSWLPAGSVAAASIVLASTVHGLRPRAGAWIQNAVVIAKLILLGSVLVFAATKIDVISQTHGSVPAESALSGWPLVAAMAGSLVWISLSYSGFNAAVYVAGEVNDAHRQVPRALVAGTMVVVVLYVLLNAIFVYAPSPESISGQPDVAAIAARALGGPWFENFVRWTIAACLLTSVFSMMMAAPRVYAKMADDGLMPAKLRFQGDSPVVATAVQMVLAIALVALSNLQGLLSYLGLTLSITAACSVACLLLPSVRRKPVLHPVHWLPIAYVTCTLIAATILTVSDPWQIVGTAITFLAGGIGYWVARSQMSATDRSNRGV
ncbi:APC family permease [Allorhodopirellula solitaria]|uniref:Serine/threonine exchanger SteT n=1 Tax=Allorhodopirellula solitaria TaxID=2527987 RepID=A0A5C5YG06_9BACT|nr:APC family permease [Allorhodopirellula solitaria]TWT74018.1 Serine/threonine exchanger SteT [Allorhodopirellula solitaria]